MEKSRESSMEESKEIWDRGVGGEKLDLEKINKRGATMDKELEEKVAEGKLE